MAVGSEQEIRQGDRFGFGANWSDFLSTVEERHIERAEESLKEMFGLDRLDGLRFLDAGCGSGLFSLAARRLGASVHSFDYDAHSVACTAELKRRYFPDDSRWTSEEGSVLDAAYLEGVGVFDIVYSWGVLHHTGQMWEAMERVSSSVAEKGMLFIAIYNYQPIFSNVWTRIKRAYNQWPDAAAKVLLWAIVGWYECAKSVLAIAKMKDVWPPRRWERYRRQRGMSLWHDYVDWIGGYPFEVARPEDVFRFYQDRGYVLRNLKTCSGRHGCNEFVFRKEA